MAGHRIAIERRIVRWGYLGAQNENGQFIRAHLLKQDFQRGRRKEEEKKRGQIEPWSTTCEPYFENVVKVLLLKVPHIAQSAEEVALRKRSR